jgi:hypothetical protein
MSFNLFLPLTPAPCLFQPPVVVTPCGSDESSTDVDNRADPFSEMEGLAEPISLNADIAPIDSQPSSGFDPIPVKFPSPSVILGRMGRAPSIEPYQMVSSGSQSNAPHSWSVQGDMLSSSISRSLLNWEFMVESNTAVAAPRSARADHILDEAVDEIFSSGALPEDLANLDDLWDNAAFCEETVQDDTQLGFLLDRFLEGED